MPQMQRKIVVVGIDGAEPRLVARLIKDGRLPNMRFIRENGMFGDLVSTIHPNTPPAWTSFSTGVNPGKHGVYDFRIRVADSYATAFATSQSIRAPAIWDILGASGKTVGIINVPITFPPRPVNGFLIGGMHAPSLEQATYPLSLAGEISGKGLCYVTDILGVEKDELFDRAVAVETSRAAVAEELCARYAPDYFMCVFTAADRLQHVLWDQVETYLHGGCVREPDRLGLLIDIYAVCDKFLGTVLDRAKDDDMLFVVSDHGFGRLEKDVYLNSFLRQCGYLRLLPSGAAPLWQAAPEGAESEGFDRVDWAKTQAYARGFFGNVYLNVKHREPCGAVEPGREYISVRERIVEDLWKWEDSEAGGKIVDAVYRREELYHGSQSDMAPDLVVVMRNYSLMARDGAEFEREGCFSEPLSGHTGNHRRNGLFMAHGAGVRGARACYRVPICGVAPTVLSLMGIGIPAEMDDVPIFAPSGRDLNTDALKTVSSTAWDSLEPRPSPLSSEEESLIRSRMKDLGYMR